MWYYSDDGTQRGPFSEREFQRCIQSGEVAPDDLVWHSELSGWTPAKEVPDLLMPPPPSDASAQERGASLRAAAERGLFGNERHWESDTPSDPFEPVTPPPDRSRKQAQSAEPSAQHAEDSATYEENPSFFGYRGRLGRLSYFLRSFSIAFVLVVPATIAEEVGAPGSAALLYFVAAVLLSFPAVQRLHDVNLSGWFYWIGLIPVVNVLFGLYMLFASGTDGPNRYGPAPS